MLNASIRKKYIIPLSLKYPEGGMSKISVKIPGIMTTIKPYDPKDFKFQKMNLAVTAPSHLSLLEIYSESPWQIYIQAQTPSDKTKPWLDKKKGIQNPAYKVNLGPSIVIRNKKANHAAGSVVSQDDWQKAMSKVVKANSSTLYRSANIPGVTKEPPEGSAITLTQYNTALDILKDITNVKNDWKNTEYDEVWPQFRQQILMWSSWAKFFYDHFDEVFKITYLMGKKEGGYAGKGGLNDHTFTAHWVMENKNAWLTDTPITEVFA